MTRTKKRWDSKFDLLESREMLSLSGVGHPLQASATPTSEVEAAYTTFVAQFMGQEKTILLSSSTPSANRATFNSNVTILLNNLDSTIDTDIASLPSEATLAPAIQAQLTSAAANSLESELAAIASPPTTGTADVQLFNNEVLSAVGVSAYTVVQEVTLATPPSPLPTGNALITYEVSTALKTFQAEYSASIGSILYAANPSTGNINLTTNRVLFNSAIGADLTQLQTGLLAAVSSLDNSTLNTAITTAVSTLKTQLLGIPTPSGGYTTSALIFTIDSDLLINSFVSSVNSEVTAALPPS